MIYAKTTAFNNTYGWKIETIIPYDYTPENVWEMDIEQDAHDFMEIKGRVHYERFAEPKGGWKTYEDQCAYEHSWDFKWEYVSEQEYIEFKEKQARV